MIMLRRKGAAVLTATLLTAVVFAAQGRPAQAFPKFAQKEGKPCAYCHVKPAGGGKRTPAGEWYKTHGLSLAGFKEPAPAKPAKPAAKPSPAPKKKPASKKTGKKP